MAPKMQYLFCDDDLIYACNLAGYMFTVDTEFWLAWLDAPPHKNADKEPYAMERFVLPHAFSRWDDLTWRPIQSEHGSHLHLRGFLAAADPAVNSALMGLINSLPDGVIDEARDGIGHTNAGVIIHWRDKAKAALKPWTEDKNHGN